MRSRWALVALGGIAGYLVFAFVAAASYVLSNYLSWGHPLP